MKCSCLIRAEKKLELLNTVVCQLSVLLRILISYTGESFIGYDDRVEKPSLISMASTKGVFKTRNGEMTK